MHLHFTQLLTLGKVICKDNSCSKFKERESVRGRVTLRIFVKQDPDLAHSVLFQKKGPQQRSFVWMCVTQTAGAHERNRLLFREGTSSWDVSLEATSICWADTGRFSDRFRMMVVTFLRVDSYSVQGNIIIMKSLDTREQQKRFLYNCFYVGWWTNSLVCREDWYGRENKCTCVYYLVGESTERWEEESGSSA